MIFSGQSRIAFFHILCYAKNTGGWVFLGMRLWDQSYRANLVMDQVPINRVLEVLWRNGFKASWTWLFLIVCQIFGIFDHFSKWSSGPVKLSKNIKYSKKKEFKASWTWLFFIFCQMFGIFNDFSKVSPPRHFQNLKPGFRGPYPSLHT